MHMYAKAKYNRNGKAGTNDCLLEREAPKQSLTLRWFAQKPYYNADQRC
jgi:hypothetical protein